MEMKEKRREEEEVGSGEGQPGEERLVNKRMDGVDRRMLNGARGHLISSYGFYQDWLRGVGGEIVFVSSRERLLLNHRRIGFV